MGTEVLAEFLSSQHPQMQGLGWAGSMGSPLPGQPRPGLLGVCLLSQICSPHSSSRMLPSPCHLACSPLNTPPLACKPSLSHAAMPFSISSSFLPVIQQFSLLAVHWNNQGRF